MSLLPHLRGCCISSSVCSPGPHPLPNVRVHQRFGCRGWYSRGVFVTVLQCLCPLSSLHIPGCRPRIIHLSVSPPQPVVGCQILGGRSPPCAASIHCQSVPSTSALLVSPTCDFPFVLLTVSALVLLSRLISCSSCTWGPEEHLSLWCLCSFVLGALLRPSL